MHQLWKELSTVVVIVEKYDVNCDALVNVMHLLSLEG